MTNSPDPTGSWFKNYSKLPMACCLLLLLSAGVLFAQSGAPRGWFLAGDHPQNYVTGVDKGVAYQGRPSAYLKSKGAAADGFGTLMQEFDAASYVGKRVRVTCWITSENVGDWAGLWMRVDSGSKTVAFDNMQSRAIHGTTGWRNYAVVLDVPKDATGIFFGVLVSKTGTVWLNSVQFDAVGTDVPVTSMSTGNSPPQLPSGPTNLNFEEQ